MRLHFVRHGEVHNPRAVMYGRLPRFRLSQRGVRQAEEAAVYLRQPLTLLLCSPMLRARETARVLQREQARALRLPHGPPVREEGALLEVHLPHDGRPLSDFVNRWHTLYENLPAGFESFEDVAARLRALIARLAARLPADAEVACVTHGDLVFSARLIGAGLPTTLESKKREDARLYPMTASIVTLQVDVAGRVRSSEYWAPSLHADTVTNAPVAPKPRAPPQGKKRPRASPLSRARERT